MIRSLGLAFSLLIAAVASAGAQAAKVESLLKSGFTIVGVIPSNAGPGIFLVKGDQLYGCFVAETPKSAEIATRYCKPVK
jgi:hypothetical protein